MTNTEDFFTEFKDVMLFLNPYNLLPGEENNWQEICEQLFAEDEGWA